MSFIFTPDVVVNEVAAPDQPFRFKWLGVEVSFCPKTRTVTAPLSAADPSLQSWLRTIFGDEEDGE
jgi:hypothetical protein